MTDSVTVDFSDLQTLAADIGKVPENAGPKIVDATSKTALSIKNDWGDKLAGAASLPDAARAIGYDMGSSGESLAREARSSGSGELANTVIATIGARLGGQGSLVGIVEFGSPTSGPRGYGAAALQENAEKFQELLAKALVDAQQELDIT